MLDIKVIRQNPDKVKGFLAKRNADVNLDKLLELDSKRRTILLEGDELKARRNQFSEQMARSKGGSEEQKQQVRQMGERIKTIDAEMKDIDAAIDDIIKRIPNIPHESVPLGSSEEDNQIVRTCGEKPSFSFTPKEHWEIGETLGILDFKRAAKITGARFCLNWAAGAKLERSLINFMLDVHTDAHGYTEVWTPFLANRDSFTATGQLPKFEEDLFRTDDYFLIPTAEVPVTNIYRDEVIPENKLPVKLVAYTPCFRREAGSYGKDTRGLIRQHQFDKVELVRFANPNHSFDDLEELTAEAEVILKRLGLHYRVVELCTGDLGFSSAKTYDLEVWMPGQGVYKEISSCSCFTDFQARRGSIRYKSPNMKKSEFCHTLNGSGLAVGRTLAAILENYQNADSTVSVPDALKPYMGLDQITPIS